MYLKTGRPFTGPALDRLKHFLARCGLNYDDRICFSAALMEGERIVATGSLDGATLKCIAVDPERQGEDLCAQVLTCLRQEAFARSEKHLMLYTKPENETLFSNLGFYPLARTRDCLLMEDQRHGLDTFLNEIRCSEITGFAGSIVAHCNPFTLGHRFLIEQAAKRCEAVYVFILSEKGGPFSPELRLEMAQRGCADLKNVFVRPSGPYMVSAATFPDYFLKEKARAQSIHCELDVRLFGARIAPFLKINRRFVGDEPLCPVTRRYNEELARRLPDYGIELTQIHRLEVEGACVSASRVRERMREGNFRAIQTLVPASSYEIICRSFKP